MDSVWVQTGDTLNLKPVAIAKNFSYGRQRLLGFNGRFPGPVIWVEQGSEFVVAYTHRLPLRHGLIFLGLPYELINGKVGEEGNEGATDAGDTLFYRVTASVPGIFEYRAAPHEDYLRGSGLVGALRVRARDTAYWDGIPDREEILVFDEIGSSRGAQTWKRQTVENAFSGSYGTHLLINGEEHFQLNGKPYERIRFFTLNGSNSRSVILDFGGIHARYNGGDIGRIRFAELLVQTVLGPGERAIADLLPSDTGNYRLGLLTPSDPWEPPSESYGNLRITGTLPDSAQAFALEKAFTFSPDRRMEELPRGYSELLPALNRPVDRFLQIIPNKSSDPSKIDGIVRETLVSGAAKVSHATPQGQGFVWNDTGKALQEAKKIYTNWTLHDLSVDSGGNHSGAWQYRVGDTIKVRIENDSLQHFSMAHTFQLPGQKFLVLQQIATGGIISSTSEGEKREFIRVAEPEFNFAWRSTYILPAGRQVEIILVFQSPGNFRLGCSLAEHAAGGEWLEIQVKNR
jgi:FtsP/CotA-like multicopper oxidase with cupredoxin domain